MPLKITAVTRDGRPRENGGVLVGYAVGGFFVEPGRQPVPLHDWLHQFEPPKPKLKYADLPEVPDSRPYCGHCDRAVERVTLETDQGPKEVLRCTYHRCGKLSRVREEPPKPFVNLMNLPQVLPNRTCSVCHDWDLHLVEVQTRLGPWDVFKCGGCGSLLKRRGPEGFGLP